jgi:hypothetical protein
VGASGITILDLFPGWRPVTMKMFLMKCRRHKATTADSAANPLNELTLTQLYDVWSSSIAEGEDYKTDQVLERIKRVVEEESLNTEPIHLVRALIRFTSTCNDYVLQSVEGRN